MMSNIISVTISNKKLRISIIKDFCLEKRCPTSNAMQLLLGRRQRRKLKIMRIQESSMIIGVSVVASILWYQKSFIDF